MANWKHGLYSAAAITKRREQAANFKLLQERIALDIVHRTMRFGTRRRRGLVAYCAALSSTVLRWKLKKLFCPDETHRRSPLLLCRRPCDPEKAGVRRAR